MDMFFGILFILFMFIGILFTAYAVLYLLLKPKNKNEILVYPLNENSGDIRAVLSFIDFRCTLFGAKNVVIIDTGMNNIQRDICIGFCEKSSWKLIYPEEITEVL